MAAALDVDDLADIEFEEAEVLVVAGDTKELLVVEDSFCREFKASLCTTVIEALSADDGICGIVKLDLIFGVGGVVFGVGSTVTTSFVLPLFIVDSGDSDC